MAIFRDPSTGPCFCAVECPYPTRPTRQYSVENFNPEGVNGPPELDIPKLFVFTEAIPPACIFLPKDEIFPPPAVTRLSRSGRPPGPFTEHVWEMRLEWVPPVTPGRLFLGGGGWNDVDWPDNLDNGRCDREVTMIATEPIIPIQVIAVPIPPWICSQADLDAFWERNPRP